MKIGIISDVHSNIQALNVVMAKFDEEKGYVNSCIRKP